MDKIILELIKNKKNWYYYFLILATKNPSVSLS